MSHYQMKWVSIFLFFSGVTSSGYSCGICKYKAHKSCASNVVVNCKWTTLNTVDETSISRINVINLTSLYKDWDIIHQFRKKVIIFKYVLFQGVNHMHHQWIEGNLPVASKCAVCDKTCGSVIRYINFLQLISQK